MAKSLKELLETEIKKSTEGDKRNILSNELDRAYRDEDDMSYLYLMDYDDEYVYFEVYGEGAHVTIRDTYTMSGMSAKFGMNPEKVARTTEYVVVEDDEDEDVEKSIRETVSDWLTKHFGGSSKQPKVVMKQFNEEEMIAIEKLYIHPDDVDGVGDCYDLEGARDLVKSFNEANEAGTLQTGLFHEHKTEAFTIDKAWIAECDCKIGETEIREGQPLVQLQFHNTEAWELRKSGEIGGVSIHARAKEVVMLDGEEDA